MGMMGGALDRVRQLFRRDRFIPDSNQKISQNDYYSRMGMFGHDLTGGQQYSVGVSDYVRLENDLISRMIDAEEMDDNPIISSAFDIYSDDTTQIDLSSGKSLIIKSEDEEIKSKIEENFNKDLRIEEEIWEMARTLVKYGNNYEELIIKENEGVVALNFLPPPTVRRIDGDRGEQVGFIQDYRGQFNISTKEFIEAMEKKGYDTLESLQTNKPRVFEDWEVVHSRLRSRNRQSLYGFSVADNCRWIWKRLTLIEDAVLVYKLTRSPSRYAFYVDVGDLPPNEARSHLAKVRDQFKKNKFINPNSNKIDQKFNALSIDEDFFLPVRDGKDGTKVDVLSGPASQPIDDVEYFQEKLFAALKIPKAYLSQENNMAKTSLAQMDVRFSRSVLRVQRGVRNGLKQIARVHLASIGVDPDQTEFEIGMTVPSAVFELAKMEVENAKLDLATRYGEFASSYWIMSKILGWTDDEIAEIRAQKEQEAPPVEGAVESVKPRKDTITDEQRLFAGNKDSEKRLSQEIDQILKNDRRMSNRVDELKDLMSDLRGSIATK